MDEGSEVLQVTFLLDCTIEVGFKPMRKEFEFGNPIFFLVAKENAIGDYECMFSERSHHVIKVKGKQNNLAYFIRANKWRTILKTIPKAISDSLTFKVMRAHHVLGQRVAFYRSKYARDHYTIDSPDVVSKVNRLNKRYTSLRGTSSTKFDKNKNQAELMLKFPWLGSFVKVDIKMFIKDPFEEDRKKIDNLEAIISDQVLSKYENLFTKIIEQEKFYQRDIVRLRINEKNKEEKMRDLQKKVKELEQQL
jgi:hypothetical protein